MNRLRGRLWDVWLPGALALTVLGLPAGPTDAALLTAVRIKNIRPGLSSSNPQQLTNVNGTLFFRANDGSSGDELWKSDGTAEGTVLVKDIRPGNFSSDPERLTNVNRTLFFSAIDGSAVSEHGRELWKSDGTTGGTVLVKDINPGVFSSGPEQLTNVNGTLFFTADDGVSGRELWKSDGTAAGTVPVKDVNPGAFSSDPSIIANVDGTVFFSARDRDLWKSDGTEAGTVRLKEFGFCCGPPPRFATSINRTLFFVADDGLRGAEIWRTDGTSAGTVLVKDIGSLDSFLCPCPDFLTNVNGTLFFTPGGHAPGGVELWKSDGTEAGTVRVKDILPGEFSSNPTILTNVNGTLFFVANDGSRGRELWKSNGTAAGTVRVKDIRPGAGSSNPEQLTNVNGTLFFTADDGSRGRELWRSDGTAAGTQPVNIRPGGNGSAPTLLMTVNGRLFFTANDGVIGRELWTSSGTSAGTVLVRDIRQGVGGSDPASFTDVNGRLFFTADDGVSGRELWRVPVENRLVTGAGPNGEPVAQVFDAETGTSQFSVVAFAPEFRGGVRVAAGDVTGDRTLDLIVGAGPGDPPRVKVFEGGTFTHTLRHVFLAYSFGFRGGIFVAAGDVNGDGKDDIVTGAGPGGAPHVKVFDGRDVTNLLRSFLAYPAEFGGGVSVAVGDVNGDGRADIVTGPGPGTLPHVKVFDGRSLRLLRSFLAYNDFRGGVFVAAGDVNGDGKADIVTGPGPGGVPHVKVFDGRTGKTLHSFLAFPASFRGGVNVGAGFVNGDGKADLITGKGPGGAAEVRVFDGATLAPLRTFLAHPPPFSGGVFVGASSR
jgi:ELWxxDGT repeat protein